MAQPLIWGDKKYVLPSLLAEFAGKVNLVYIDPPFNVGADFSFTATIPDYLDTDEDETTSFLKLPEQFGFAIEYTDSNNNLRYYEPDFVVVLTDGTHHLVETKGREDVDVANKDRAAILWCENATQLTGTSWQYVKVPQKEYEKLHPEEFANLAVFEQTPMI